MPAVKTCLLDAVAQLQKSGAFDDETLKESLGQMRSIINRNANLTLEAQIARAKEILKVERNRAAHAKLRKLHNERAEAALRAELDALPTPGAKARFLRNIIETDMDFGGKQQSLSDIISFEMTQQRGRLAPLWDYVTRQSVGMTRENVPEMQAVARELLGLDSGNATAKQVAKLTREQIDAWVVRAQQAGVLDAKRENWFPQTHNFAGINAAKAEWIGFLRENLDPVFHPDPESTSEHVFKTLENRNNDTEALDALGSGRQLHWKSAEAEMQYATRFGEENLVKTLDAGILGLIRRTIVAERLGPGAIGMVKRLTKELREEVNAARNEAVRLRQEGTPEATERAKKIENDLSGVEQSRLLPGFVPGQLDATVQLIDSITGNIPPPLNGNIAGFFSTARNLSVMQLLGMVAIDVVGQDLPLSIIRGRTAAGGLARSASGIFGNLRRLMTDENLRDYALSIGLLEHRMHSMAAARYANPDAVLAGAIATGTQNLAAASQRWTGAMQMENVLRASYRMLVSQQLGRRARREAWGDMDRNYRRTLENNGWTESKWRQFATIMQQDNAILMPYRTINPEVLPADLRRLVSVTGHRESEMAVLRPQHFDRLIQTGSIRRGDIRHEMVASTTQFMSWPITFVRRAMAREHAMGGAGFVGFSVGMMLTGMVTSQLRALINDEPAFKVVGDDGTVNGLLVARSLQRSGLLTPIGELAIQAATAQGRTGIDFGGPAIQLTAQSFQGLARAGGSLLDGDPEVAGRQALRALKPITIPNVWYAEALVSRAEHLILWELDPQFMRAQERRFESQGRNVE